MNGSPACKRWRLFVAVALSLFLNSAAMGGTVFQIGQVDASCAEFGLIRATFTGYQQRYPNPIVFDAAEDKPTAWPYIHPSTADGWAGAKAHPFTVRFRVNSPPPSPLVLSVGLAESFTPSLVSVNVNGTGFPGQRPTPGDDRLAHNPTEGGGTISTLYFDIPEGVVVAGDNTLAITLDDGSWVIYDFVHLGTERVRFEVPDIVGAALEGSLANVDDIVFAARQDGKDAHWYANFSYYAADTTRLTYGLGGKLYRLNLRSGDLHTLLDAPQGSVRDPQVHYDGKKILFSYLKAGDTHFHLYEINIDGTGLRQLTDGDADDIEPTYLPDGDILFCSTRCKRWVNCWLTQVANIHRCDADGGGIHPVSANIEHDNTPWPLPDGRILYQRWEYIDRSQVHYHHLWTMNPDGTGQMVYYGNQRPGIVMIDAKPIPGTGKVAAIFSPGHGRHDHEGALAIVDPRAGPDARDSATTIHSAADLRDPWPFSEDLFLAARGAQLVLLNGRGFLNTIFTLPQADQEAGLKCHEPRPLLTRAREHVIPPRTKPQAQTGRLVLADVYKGRNMDGVERGTIKKLLVVESLPKPINFTGGMEPLSYGGTFTLERALGTVPVDEDGSAHFEVPALRSLFLVALDENDMAVKRMQSFLSVMPGEVTSCVGCHEPRTGAIIPPAALTATARPPDTIEPIPDVPDVFDFPRDIQPILNKHCVACHGYVETNQGGPRSGGVILAGDRGPLYSHSYFMLSARRQLADGRNLPRSNYAPRALGSSASELMKKIRRGHHGVALSEREERVVRLWIETGAPYLGTYAGLGSGMIGGYEQNVIDRGDLKWPVMKKARRVLRSRCSACHKEKTALPSSPTDNMGMPPWAIQYDSPKLRFSRHILYNLSRPEHSLQLLAPLARAAGGYGICLTKPEEPKSAMKPRPVFAETSDPDYQTLLAAIQATQRRLDEIKRFDMPGFVPRKGYLREMKRYGVLPADHPDDVPVDIYALDRRYWALHGANASN
ncbi:MAG: hypothetical protein GWP08_14710 [Nitrospiraceae bacterium]|nr:hypothetical protein [Nitrospiraceae bacterium]